MARKRYSPEEIIEVLREVEIHTSQGKTVAEAVKQQGIAEQTYYRWRREYGGMDKSEVRPHSALDYRPPAPEAILVAAPPRLAAVLT
jgi:putative transposase